jgi:hypothetical protein
MLCMLSGTLVLMAVWLAVRMAGADVSPGVAVSSMVVACVVFLNLAFVPVAGAVIVIRRRHVRSIQEGTP